jgi:hypothetical protein
MAERRGEDPRSECRARLAKPSPCAGRARRIEE